MKYKVLAPILPGIGSKVIEAGEIVTGEQVPEAAHFISIGVIEPLEVKRHEVEQKKVETEKTKRRTARKKSGEK